MQRYDAVLLDADGTILDFDRAEKASLCSLLRELGLPDGDGAAALYHKINKELWLAHERGEVTKDELQLLRFERFFDALSVAEVDCKAFARRYLEALSASAYCIQGAEEVCRLLAADRPLFLVTNGIAKTQRNRLERSGLGQYFTRVFISEELGFQKPQKEYFDAVFAKIGWLRPERTLIAGDSLTADIRGGADYGMDTCWVNPDGAQNPGGVSPTYEIQRLEELLSIALGSV